VKWSGGSGKGHFKNDVSVLTNFHPVISLLRRTGLGFSNWRSQKKETVLPQGTSEFLGASHSYQTRLPAAHYFARSQKVVGELSKAPRAT